MKGKSSISTLYLDLINRLNPCLLHSHLFHVPGISIAIGNLCFGTLLCMTVIVVAVVVDAVAVAGGKRFVVMTVGLIFALSFLLPVTTLLLVVVVVVVLVITIVIVAATVMMLVVVRFFVFFPTPCPLSFFQPFS